MYTYGSLLVAMYMRRIHTLAYPSLDACVQALVPTRIMLIDYSVVKKEVRWKPHWASALCIHLVILYVAVTKPRTQFYLPFPVLVFSKGRLDYIRLSGPVYPALRAR